MKKLYSRLGIILGLLLLFSQCQQQEEAITLVGEQESDDAKAMEVISLEKFMSNEVFSPFANKNNGLTTESRKNTIPKKDYSMLGGVRTLYQEEQTVYVVYIKEKGIDDVDYFENLVVEKNLRGLPGIFSDMDWIVNYSQ